MEGVTRTSTVALLHEKSRVSKSLEHQTGCGSVGLKYFSNSRVGEDLATCCVDEHHSIRPGQGTPAFELGDPRSLLRRNDAPERKRDLDGVAEVLNHGIAEHFFSHRVLHDIDAPSGVFRKTEPSQGRNYRDVPWGIRLSNVLDGYRFGQPTRAGDTDKRRPQFDSNRNSVEFI